jgi:hypothetical protein
LQNEQDTAAQSAVETMKKEVLNRARENAQLPQLPRVAAEAKSADETESAPISVTGK